MLDVDFGSEKRGGNICLYIADFVIEAQRGCMHNFFFVVSV
jgi:hypothetical protein